MSKANMEEVPHYLIGTNGGETPALVSYAQIRQQQIAAQQSQMNSSWAKADAIYWSSAIFSRPAMRVNHVMAHRYGERKALGVYRVIAAILMTTMTAFLTVYEITVSESRPWLTMVWWVSLGTTIFFMITLTSFADYFSDKVPDPKRAVDGASPFYSWKVVSFMNGFLFQAGLHLILLMSFSKQQSLQMVDILLNSAPFFLLMADWLTNRIYLNLFLLTAYPLVCYSVWAAYEYLIKPTLTSSAAIPELDVFSIKWSLLGWLLPALLPLAVYLVTRVKFIFLEDGDIEQLKFWSMIDVVEQVLEQGPNQQRRKREKVPRYNSDSSFFEEPREESLSEFEDEQYQDQHSQIEKFPDSVIVYTADGAMEVSRELSQDLARNISQEMSREYYDDVARMSKGEYSDDMASELSQEISRELSRELSRTRQEGEFATLDMYRVWNSERGRWRVSLQPGEKKIKLKWNPHPREEQTPEDSMA